MESRRALSPGIISPTPGDRVGIYLYWLPLGAGGVGFVRFNGRLYETIKAHVEGRRTLDIYHTALLIQLAEGRYIVENAWPSPDADIASRGVVLEGPVFSNRLGRYRLFRYEVRRWRDGEIEDADDAVKIDLVDENPARAKLILQLTARVPAMRWGRDDLHVGEMWNSNSVISYLLTRSAVNVESILAPAGGRAPGWDAGIYAARSQEGDYEANDERSAS
jgi:hypothetical protein